MMDQKIYINGRFLTQSLTGVQRYALELIKAFDRMVENESQAFRGWTFTVLAPPGKLNAPDLKHIAIRQVGPLSGHLWEQAVLPWHTADGFLLNLCNTGPLLKRRQAVTLHDAAVYAVPETYSLLFRAWYKVLFRTLGITARTIWTCSQFSRKQLIEYCKIKPSKLQVIYHGKEHLLETPPAPGFLEAKGITRPYVLAVSSMSPNKNFRSIVQALERIGTTDYDVVIAGGTNPKVFKTPETSLPDNVKYLGYVAEEELRTLYDHASCFVFPSFYEGFGFPPLEAMACGCPVIASRAASLPEVCGEAVLYCDPHSPDDIAEQIRRMMGDAELRTRLSAKGRAQAQRFTWEQCARETMQSIREATGRQESVSEGEAGAAVRQQS